MQRGSRGRICDRVVPRNANTNPVNARLSHCSHANTVQTAAGMKEVARMVDHGGLSRRRRGRLHQIRMVKKKIIADELTVPPCRWPEAITEMPRGSVAPGVEMEFASPGNEEKCSAEKYKALFLKIEK